MVFSEYSGFQVCSIQICVIKFVSDLRQVAGFLRVLRFPLSITEILLKVALSTITLFNDDPSDYDIIIPPLPEGGGGYTVLPLSVCPSVLPSVLLSFRPSKIFFVAFFSVTVDGRNLIFGHKHLIGIPYCG